MTTETTTASAYGVGRHSASPERVSNPDAYIVPLCDHRHRTTRTALQCLDRTQRTVPTPGMHIPHTLITELDDSGHILRGHHCMDEAWNSCPCCEAWAAESI